MLPFGPPGWPGPFPGSITPLRRAVSVPHVLLLIIKYLRAYCHDISVYHRNSRSSNRYIVLPSTSAPARRAWRGRPKCYDGLSFPSTIRIGRAAAVCVESRRQGEAMDTWILGMVRARSMRRVAAWGLTAGCLVLLAFAQKRYISNFVMGPFDLGPAELDSIR